MATQWRPVAFFAILAQILTGLPAADACNPQASCHAAANPASGALEWGNTSSDYQLNKLWQQAKCFTVKVETSKGYGSGLVYRVVRNSTTGNLTYIIATNHHVVERARDVRVDIADLQFTAPVLYSDPSTDVAFILITQHGKDHLPLEEVPRCDGGAFPGKPVAAFGFFLREHLHMALGYVTGESKPHGPAAVQEIPSNVGIMKGFSGGPFMDRQGCLLGMSAREVRKQNDSMGVHLAIPVEALDSAAELMRSGRVSLPVESGTDPENTLAVTLMLAEALKARPWLVIGSDIWVHHLPSGERAEQSSSRAKLLAVDPGMIMVSGADGRYGAQCNGEYMAAEMHHGRPVYRNAANATIFFQGGMWHMDDDGTLDVRRAVFVKESIAGLPPPGLWRARFPGHADPNVSLIDATVRVRFPDEVTQQEESIPAARVDYKFMHDNDRDAMLKDVQEFIVGPLITRSFSLAVSEGTARVGQSVFRGPDWEWMDQDGGKGSEGVVTALGAAGKQGWCEVSWSRNNGTNWYRIGAQEAHDLVPAQPAERLAALWPKDIITHINGERVFNNSQVFSALRSHRPGGTANVTFTSLNRWRYLKYLGEQGPDDPADFNTEPHGWDTQQLLQEGLQAASFTLPVSTRAGQPWR